MAENNKGGILNKAEKILRRRKTKVLQSLGKQEKTTDEILIEDCHKLDRQQEVATKFQKDLRHYIHSAKALSGASKTFYTTLAETYEPGWENHSQITDILTNMDVLWQDYLQKLQDSVQEPLVRYLANIPNIKSRIAKRGRKLIDYDNAKHSLEVLQSAKKKDEAKINKAEEDLAQAKKIYEDLNNELHVELPEFYNSRVGFYGSLFQTLFSAETIFHTEVGKGAETFRASAEKLATDHEDETYTPRKNLRNTLVVGSNEHLTNGHSENGAEHTYPDTPTSNPTESQPTTPSSSGPAQGLTNGAADADTKPGKKLQASSESEGKGEVVMEDSERGEENKEVEVKAEVFVKVQAAPRKSAEVKKEVDEKEKVQAAQRKSAEVKKEVDEEEKVPATQRKSAEVKKEVDEEKDKDEVKVNGDLDASVDAESHEDAPPPVPASPPPEEDKDVKPNDDNDDDDDDENEGKEHGQDDGLYQVPPPAKPVADDLPAKYLYTVMATHSYKGEDDDELSFDAQEIIYVIEYDDPEEQDPGWLMGVRKMNRQMGVFPENFTKRV